MSDVHSTKHYFPISFQREIVDGMLESAQVQSQDLGSTLKIAKGVCTYIVRTKEFKPFTLRLVCESRLCMTKK